RLGRLQLRPRILGRRARIDVAVEDVEARRVLTLAGGRGTGGHVRRVVDGDAIVGAALCVHPLLEIAGLEIAVEDQFAGRTARGAARPRGDAAAARWRATA